MEPHQAEGFAQTFDQMVANVEQALMGKTHQVRLALTTLLADGHLLLEDDPGTGKTLLARAIAKTVQGTDRRIQFTPDLLPSDVTGVTIWDQEKRKFRFRPGPIFATIVLADEINRASPKTQSALLEVMEEGQVTIDGTTRRVRQDDAPFMVIATQNKHQDQQGTYRLPDAQLDRFMMRFELGHPDRETTVALLSDAATRNRATRSGEMITGDVVRRMSQMADGVHIDINQIDYIVQIAEETRRDPQVRLGVSARGCLSYVRAVKTWAASRGRHYVVPDDIKELALPIMGHRIILNPEDAYEGASVVGILQRILAEIPAPDDRGFVGP